MSGFYKTKNGAWGTMWHPANRMESSLSTMDMNTNSTHSEIKTKPKIKRIKNKKITNTQEECIIELKCDKKIDQSFIDKNIMFYIDNNMPNFGCHFVMRLQNKLYFIRLSDRIKFHRNIVFTVNKVRKLINEKCLQVWLDETTKAAFSRPFVDAFTLYAPENRLSGLGVNSDYIFEHYFMMKRIDRVS